MSAMSSPRPRPTPRRSEPPPAGSVPPPFPPSADAEYTERLVVPSQLALSALTGAAAAVILLALGLWPLAIVAVLVVATVVYYLGVQILAVTPTTISISQGRGDKSPHLIQAGEVVAADVVTLTWPQCFGLGLPDTVDTTRFTVRAGPAVSLTMRDGEELRISTDDPHAVLDRFGRG